MITASGNGSLIIGLTRANLDRLQQGSPAKIDLPYPQKVDRVIVLMGEDKPAILAQLEAAGVEVPNAAKQDAERDPK